jgi:hypothetical protein
MDTDLETCIIAFVIGISLYLLVNRVFMVEGITGETCSVENCDKECIKDEPCFCDNTCVPGLLGCSVHGIDKCRFCGFDRYSDINCPSPGQSPSPPSKGLTNDEKILKSIIETAMEVGVDNSLDRVPDTTSDPIISSYNILRNDIVSELPDHSVVGLFFHFEYENEIEQFKQLLSNNNNPLINLGGNPIILLFQYSYGKENYSVSFNTSEVISIANCFNEDIIGITVLSRRLSGDIKYLSDLTGLKYLDLRHTGVDGDFSALSGLTGLKYLDLKDTGVEGDINYLSDLTGLKYLDLSKSLESSNTGVEGNLNQLSKLTGLKCLALSSTGVEGNLNQLSNLLNLKILEFNYCPGVKGNLSALGGLKGLITLIAYYNPEIKGNLGDLSDLTKLQYISLSEARIGGNLSVLEKLSKLIYLDLSYTIVANDLSLFELKTKFPNLLETKFPNLLEVNLCTAPIHPGGRPPMKLIKRDDKDDKFGVVECPK